MNTRGRWLELRARRTVPSPVADDADEAELADALVALGGRAVEAHDGWLFTHLPEPPDSEAFMAAAAPRLSDLVGEPVMVAFDWRATEDWTEAWKRGLGPRRITPRMWVTPSWERAPAGPHDIVVVVDPGMAFGTAEHGTTRGALRLLDRALVPGERMLDVGAGSAILAVAAALLGAGEVVAIEGDSVAAEYARENIERNGVCGRVRWVGQWAEPGLLLSFGPVDGVLANIESGVLRRLLPGLRDVVRPGGWLILSGLLAEEWEGFARDVVLAGLVPGDVDEDGEWRSGRFTRPAAPSVHPLD